VNGSSRHADPMTVRHQPFVADNKDAGLDYADASVEQLQAEATELRRRITELEAVQIQSRQVEETLRQRNLQLALLNSVMAGSVAELEPEALVSTACRELARATGVSRAAGFLLETHNIRTVAVTECLADAVMPPREDKTVR